MQDSKKELLRGIKFTLFSISAGVIQILVDTLCLEVFHLEAWISYLIALVASVLWNFTFNRRYTFASATNVPIAMAKVALFYAVFTPLSTWWTAALTQGSFGIFSNEYVVLVATMLVNFVTEFFYQRFFVFGKSLDTLKK